MTDASDRADWDDFAALLRWASVLFGQPSDLLESQVVERAQGLRLRTWLRALEAMARALLLSMAAALGALPPIRKRLPHPRSEAAEAPPADTAAGSECWAGVSFALLPPKHSEDYSSSNREGAERRFVWTRRLAFRFEALIRVAENPAAYARRAARRLNAVADAADRALTPIQSAGSVPRDIVIQAQEGARATLRLGPGSG